MAQSPQNSTFRRLYEDFQKGGGLGNTLKAAGAGLLGFPSDIVQTMAAVAQPPAVRAVHGSPQVPGNSEQIAGLLGADLERPTGMLGLMGSPDPSDIGRLAGVGLLGKVRRVDKLPTSDLNLNLNPSSTSGKRVYVIQNPSQGDIASLRKEIRADFFSRGWDPSGQPLTRQTFDADGNKWVWSAAEATHEDIESALKRGLGDIELNQNEYFFD